MMMRPLSFRQPLRRMFRSHVMFMTLATLAVIGVASSSAVAQGRSSGLTGRPVPNFTFTDAITKKRYSLEDFRGKAVVIDFWATWCGPCIAELPNVQRAYKKYKDQGLEIISISLDSNPGKCRQFIRSKRMDWKHAIEGGGWKTRLAQKFSIRSIPRMMVVGPDGVCVQDQVRGAALERAIETALRNVDPEALTPASGGGGSADDTDGHVEMRTMVAEAKDAAARAATVIEPLRAQLDEIDRAMQSVASFASSPDGLRAGRYEGLHYDVASLRLSLFMHGLVTTPEALRLPAATTDADDDRLRAAQVRRRLDTMEGAVEQYRAAVATLEEDHAEATRLIARVERGMEQDRRSAASLLRDAQRARDLAKEAADATTNGWRRHLDRAHETFGPLMSGGGTTDASELEETVAAARELFMDAQTGGTRALRAFAEAFDTVCLSIEAEHQRLVGAGAIESGAVALPHNPFGDRLKRDTRTRLEAAQQLDVAERAAEALAGASVDAPSSSSWSDELADLQSSLASGETSSDEAKSTFERLCREALAHTDRASG